MRKPGKTEAAMREIIILAAGRGTKMFPFDRVGSKTMRPLAGKPILARLVDTLRTVAPPPIRIHIVTLDEYFGTIAGYFEEYAALSVHGVKESGGSAETLFEGFRRAAGPAAGGGFAAPESFMVLHGDTVIDEASLGRLWEAKEPAVLVFPVRGRPGDWICCSLDRGRVGAVGAHHRGREMTHQMAGFVLPRNFEKALIAAPDYFPGMKAGEGAPREKYLEAALARWLGKNAVAAVEAAGGTALSGPYFFDIDKPWQLLEANCFCVERACAALHSHEPGEGSSVDPGADIRGFIRLGKNSRIGKGVRVEGNLIAGDDTVIDNGAVIGPSVVVGNETLITNYAMVHGGSALGSGCRLGHCAEFLGGILMDKVYLSHYGEFYGAAGNCVDFGAGTVSGTLRFDDGAPELRVKGRREQPGDFACASLVGDYSRTGVGVMLMPGCRIGSYCAVGPGVAVRGDYDHKTLTQLVQQLEVKEWGPEQYGW
jgi:bifunctional UDP-N-acetylglucosamine pyrophosphorylase/glucosamine-1-phosphate N-acetyltransferase